ncbi:hypothetical protein KFE25_005706 [Diacronema lutheri]|uniref:Uncharacterized protein n=1 Tax=Diacronema lutheri TaxID=2081491 RepID=A0A8J5X9U3_DIALT|nr:hypothetical protein KFE25_005706 [Diacronema lutheri]
MTVLPTTAGWFSPAAEVMVNGTAHRLLLRAEHAIDVRSVHNLLRETYHSVALLDADASELGQIPRLSRLLRGCVGRRSRFVPRAAPPARPVAAMSPIVGSQPQRPRGSPENGRDSGARHSSSRAATALPSLRASALPPPRIRAARRPALHGEPDREPDRQPAAACFGCAPLVLALARASTGSRSSYASADERSSVSGARLSGAALVALLHAERLRSADGAASYERTAELLAAAVEEARARQAVVALRIIALVVPLAACTLALFLWTTFVWRGVGSGERHDELHVLRSHFAQHRTQAVVVAGAFGATGNLMMLCHHPSPEQRTRLLATGIFGTLIVGGTTAPFATLLVRLAQASGGVPGRDEIVRTFWLMMVAASAWQVGANLCVCSLSLALLWRNRSDAQCLLCGQWRCLALTYAGGALTQATQSAAYALDGFYTTAPGDERGAAAARAVLSTAPTLLFGLAAVFAASPWLQRRAQALAAQPRSGMQGVVASLAPLVGYGSAEGARDAVELCAEARAALRGVALDDAGLDALGAAWLNVEARDPIVAPELTASTSTALSNSERLSAAATNDGRADGGGWPRGSSLELSRGLEAASGEAARPERTPRGPATRSENMPRQQRDRAAEPPGARTLCVDAYDWYVLRPALDILVWRLMGGGQDTIQLLPIVEGKRASDALLAAVDAFHVMYCDEPRLAERRRVARSVDTASMGAINEAVRALYPAVRDELNLGRAEAGALSKADADDGGRGWM